MEDRHFGHPSRVQVGDSFPSRVSLKAAGVHRQTQGGIAGGEREGAESIVVSGGYVDDEDYGDFIVYTGQGGRDEKTLKQIADQRLRLGNLALAKSCNDGLPVRVVRGRDPSSTFSPGSGYRYDGLYYVERYWRQRGRDGFYIWRYRLVAAGQPPPNSGQGTTSQTDVPERRSAMIDRIVRSTKVAQRVKALHDYRCQVCGEVLLTVVGSYAEGAHIRPLGRPHDGPDSEDNILCLCPNHHVLFDRGPSL